MVIASTVLVFVPSWKQGRAMIDTVLVLALTSLQSDTLFLKLRYYKILGGNTGIEKWSDNTTSSAQSLIIIIPGGRVQLNPRKLKFVSPSQISLLHHSYL